MRRVNVWMNNDNGTWPEVFEIKDAEGYEPTADGWVCVGLAVKGLVTVEIWEEMKYGVN